MNLWSLPLLVYAVGIIVNYIVVQLYIRKHEKKWTRYYRSMTLKMSFFSWVFLIVFLLIAFCEDTEEKRLKKEKKQAERAKRNEERRARIILNRDKPARW